ncbi:hypothetical protein PCYB_007490 [Plasmodium cynomolgi strain B]|uniref:Uncharacterized protein n=1 Tax=Plasmodium cynomolgi (strain B) TaxID=1120755 RepID=K6V3R7_PLACD|nr:hypothetical protein PCYB_007490 [Plasmodium cynomolgi strain B]GAB70000.1 hypothetical protein PCYB_007490 [Plasmodium cynomolgi strain B]
MPRGIIPIFTGGMVDHFKRVGTVQFDRASTKGIIFAVSVIMYFFLYLISFRLLEHEQRGLDQEFEEDDRENHERVHASEAEDVQDNHN